MLRTKLGLGSWLLIAALAGCTQDVGSGGEVESSAASLRESSLEFEVSVRGTGRATIHATVYTNENAWLGETILAVHGLAETGKTFGPLAEALFEDRVLRRRIKRVIAIDLVGRGESSFPEGLPAGVKFGDLAIEDNVSTVLQSIDALRKLRLSPQTIMGHSMGGTAVQVAQQALLDQGSSLAAKGVRSAILLAPVPPHGRPWMQPMGGDVMPFLVDDPVQGTYLSLPPEVWIPQAFTTRSGMLAPNAPTPDEVTAAGYIGFEPISTLLQLTEATLPLPGGGMITLERPSVDAGAFSLRRGTVLTLISFAEDTLVPAADLGGLYEYLTGDTRGRRYVAIATPDAVHNMFVSNPGPIVAELRR